MRPSSLAWVWTLLVIGLARAAAPVEAVVSGVGDERVTLTAAEATDWTAGTKLASADAALELVVISRVGRFVTTSRLKGGAQLALGERLSLNRVGKATLPATVRRTAAEGRGVVTSLDGDRLTARVAAPPDRRTSGRVERGGVPIAELTWSASTGDEHNFAARWRALGDGQPQLGDEVVFALAAVSSQAVRARRVVAELASVGSADSLSPDAPVLKLLQVLATHGWLDETSGRQFTGAEIVDVTRAAVADVLAQLLTDWQYASRELPPELGPNLAGQLLAALPPYRAELVERGVELSRFVEQLKQRSGGGVTLTPTAFGELSLGSGHPPLTGRAKVSLLGAAGERLRFTATLGTEGAEAYPAGRDRRTLDTAYAEYDLSRHLTLGLGREAFRLGPGLRDGVWTDQAMYPDGLHLRWRTRLFGRPFTLEQRNATFQDGERKYVALRRLAYSPHRLLELAFNEALLTDSTTQAIAAVPLPLYLARFTKGSSSNGGYGNYIFSVEANVHATPTLNAYGSLVVDDVNIGYHPKVTQKTGVLAGFNWRPASLLTGTTYRVEGFSSVNPTLYVGQLDPHLAWQRDGLFTGHPYGGDAFGVRLYGRHRFTDRFDLSADLEGYRQHRRDPVETRTQRAQVTAGYDLSSRLGLGLGFSHKRVINAGGLAGSRQIDDAVFLRTWLGY